MSLVNLLPRPDPVHRYITSGSTRVKGWLAQESATLVRVVSDTQVASEISGSVGEIGIHHGRLFILLYLLARPSERAFAIDIFEAQHLNVDKSGGGDRAIFEGHLHRLGADLSRIHILPKSSLDVSPRQLGRLVGPVRLFSIDGGHTTEIALSDLSLAEAVLTDGGVVILDDAFRSLFPGVAAALARYLLGDGALVPFAVSPEKVLLTQAQHHDRFMNAVRLGMGPLFLRHEDYFGHQVAIIRTAATLGERLQLSFASTELYGHLRRIPVIKGFVSATRPLVLRVLGR